MVFFGVSHPVMWNVSQIWEKCICSAESRDLSPQIMHPTYVSSYCRSFIQEKNVLVFEVPGWENIVQIANSEVGSNVTP